MRKIAANYIFLPGYSLVKNGYVVLNDRQIVDVVDTDGVVKEIQGLEFYGGMIVAGWVTNYFNTIKQDMNLLVNLELLYRDKKEEDRGLAIIKGADLHQFSCLPNTVIERLL